MIIATIAVSLSQKSLYGSSGHHWITFEDKAGSYLHFLLQKGEWDQIEHDVPYTISIHGPGPK